MSIIRCPGCGKRVSSQEPHCPECGCGIRDKESAISVEDAAARNARKQKYNLQYHTYFSLVVVIIGAIIMWFDYDADGETSSYSLMVVVAGIGWYLITRGRMLWDKYKNK